MRSVLAFSFALSLLACSTSKGKPEPGAAPSPAPQTTSAGGSAGGSTAGTTADTQTGGATAPPATGGGVACGPRTCLAGQVCCNESCGICTEPGGVCTQQFCEPPAPTGGCRQDSDCRAFSDYCTGCDCRALRKDDKDPTCSGPGVRCLVDPCRNKQGVCRNGQCALGDKPSP
jgi:hypothetical protein